MLKNLHELLKLMPRSYQAKLICLMAVAMLLAVLEVVTIGAIGPLVSAISAPSVAPQYAYLIVLVFILLGLSSFLSIVSVKQITLYCQQLGHFISKKLLNHYVRQEWLSHVDTASAVYIHKITYEATRLVHNVVSPVLQVLSRLLFVLVLTVALGFYQPVLTLVLAAVFILSYAIIYWSYQARLMSNGLAVTKLEEQKLSLLTEAFAAIKELKMQGQEQTIEKQYQAIDRLLVKARTSSQIISVLPKHVIELFLLSSVVAVLVISVVVFKVDLVAVMPIIAVFVFAALKMLPAFQSIYSQVTLIRANQSALLTLFDDAIAALQLGDAPKNVKELTFLQDIRLANVSFCYPRLGRSALANVSLSIKRNQSLGIVGRSGSGKTTLINIIMQLIRQDEGSLLIDGIPVCGERIEAWQKTIGLVGQEVFISNSTIAHNVALSALDSELDLEKVKTALQLASLDLWVDGLPLKHNTVVGERGLTMSGGQRQRLAIARALYQNADLLIFDEATSSLDSHSELQIVSAINALAGEKTMIVIAHRLSTVKHCDNIVVLDEGKVVGQGSYRQLLNNNKAFQMLVGEL